MSTRMVRTVALGSMVLGGQALAQALVRGPREAPVQMDGHPDHSASLRETSLIVVEAPKPKTFEVHDLITIIISQSSSQSSQQKLDTKKNTQLNGALKGLPNLQRIIDGSSSNGSSGPLSAVALDSQGEWKGDAKYERNDKFTDRMSAEVIDVKPNGVLILEARRTVTKDDEVQSIVLSGSCRREDVSNANTVLSGQVADLTLTVKNEGELRDGTKPGWISRLFGAVFNF